MKKTVSINFYIVLQGTREGDFGEDFFEKVNEFCTAEKASFFKSGGERIVYQPYEASQTMTHEFRLIAMANEKSQHPAVIEWATGDDVEEIGALSLDENESIAGLTYILIDSKTKSILSLSQGGVKEKGISDFVKHITKCENTEIRRIGVEDVLNQVLSWKIYTKLTFAFSAKTKDLLFKIFDDSTFGHFYEIVRHLEGRSMELTISADSKNYLKAGAVSAFIKKVVTEGYMKKLIVSGKISENSDVETVDICKPLLKYSTETTITGHMLGSDEAGKTLYEAFSNNLDRIRVMFDKYYYAIDNSNETVEEDEDGEVIDSGEIINEDGEVIDFDDDTETES